MTPKVSVLMPLHKSDPALLRAALDCVFAQTLKDWEIVLVNDPLDRTTPEHIQDYLKDPRVHFHQEDAPRGIGANWNACLPYATGGYLAYLFYDDLWEPEYLETLCGILDAHPSVGFVSANRSYLFMGDSPKEAIYDEATAFMESVKPGLHEGVPALAEWMDRGLKPNMVGEPSFVVLRRSLVEKVGPFHPTMAQFLDAEYWTRCFAASDWYFEPRRLGKFRVHMAGTSAQNAAAGKGLYDRLETMEAAVGLLPPRLRGRARTALRHTLADMIRRYVDRWKKARGGVKTQGGGGSAAVKKFATRHPVIMAGAVLEAFLVKAKA